MSGLVACVAAAAGLAVGVGLDLVVRRVPRGERVTAGGWGALRPEAGSRWRFAAVEVATAGLFAGDWLRFGATWTLPAMAVFFAGLVALAFCDLEHFLLPRRVVYPTLAGSGAFLVAGAAAGGEWRRLGVAASCGAVAFGVFFVLNRINPKGLGFGDVRLAGVMGLLLGWLGVTTAITGFFVASILGAVMAVALLVTRRAGRHTHLPYGVFLGAGAVVSVLAGSGFVLR